MSDEGQPQDPPATPIIPGFECVQVEDGSWSINAKGENPWFITGFQEVQDAHDWVLTYLTTNIENSARIHVEAMERKADAELSAKNALTEQLMWSEAAAKNRKVH